MPLTKIQSLGITDGAIVAADIASGAITAAKLASGVGGKVLQVVSVSYNTETSTTSSSYVDTGLSASITPSSTSNKILILASQTFYVAATSSLTYPFFILDRSGTNLNTQRQATIRAARDNNNLQSGGTISFCYLDSPATTSSRTYKVQMKNDATYGASILAQVNNTYSDITLLEIAG